MKLYTILALLECLFLATSQGTIEKLIKGSKASQSIDDIDLDTRNLQWKANH